MRWTQATWAGVEPLLDPALRRDYILTNARGVFGGLMSSNTCSPTSSRTSAGSSRSTRRRRPAAGTRRAPRQLRGKQIGLLGVGTIGAALARDREALRHDASRAIRAPARTAPTWTRGFTVRWTASACAFALGSRLPRQRHAGDDGARAISSTPRCCARCRRARCSSIRAAAASSTKPALAAALQEGRPRGRRARRVRG